MASDHPRSETTFSAEEYENEILSWQADREERLRSESGWLTIVGLHWLALGDNLVGGDPSFPVHLEGTPKLGNFFWARGSANEPSSSGLSASANPADYVVTFTAHESGIEIPFPADHAETGRVAVLPGQTITVFEKNESTHLHFDPLEFWIIERGGRIGVRVRDPESEMRKNFDGLSFHPVDSRFRIEARFEPYETPRSLGIPSVLGHVDSTECFGEFVFEWEGETHRLRASMDGVDDESPFFVFDDATSGDTTYGGGRFLVAQRIASESDTPARFLLDFNRAYNPPCARNPYTTCPLPPPGNQLSFRVEAGELAP